MKNTVALRRFFVASLIVSLTVPMLYHSALNYLRRDYYSSLTRDICKAVEPIVQTGGERQPIEFAQSRLWRQDFGYTPQVEFVDHGKELTAHHDIQLGELRLDCDFAGVSGVRMSIYYRMAPLLNSEYLFLYVLSVPLFLGLFILIRKLLDRFQRQVVDVVQAQIKRLMGLEGADGKPNGFFSRLLDLNIPLLGYLKNHIDSLEDRLAEFSRKIAEQKRTEVLSDVAAQMAHDVVAPITALQKILSSDASNEEEHRQVILEELDRIKSMTQKMLRQYRGESVTESTERFDLMGLGAMLAAEARALAAGKCEVLTTFPAKDIFINGVKSDLSAALSNIVKNAIESIDRAPGRVSISIRHDGNGKFARITVEDTGCGISPENLTRVFEKDVSYKRGGTGLGLFQAKSAIAAIGGAIALRSVVGKGTIAEIDLPTADVEHDIVIEIGQDFHLAFVDDDKLVHDVWRSILPRDFPSERAHLFLSVNEFRTWRALNTKVPTLFFVDYELDSGENGLDLIMSCGCRDSAYLVTGRAADESVRSITQANGIRLIDKIDLGRIRFHEPGPSAAAIFIDDVRANRIAWEIEAKSSARLTRTFSSVADFLHCNEKFDWETPIYVDYMFDGMASGAAGAERLLDAGFKNVYIATALPREKVLAPRGVRGVVGKEFPTELASVRSEASSV